MRVVDYDGSIFEATFSILVLEGGIISLDNESTARSAV